MYVHAEAQRSRTNSVFRWNYPLLRDRLLARLTPGQKPDYQRLACEVLGIRGAAPALARALVEQALVFEDRREHWRRVGERARREAPATPGVYVFRDWAGAALYVGKAANLRRRLSAHFADRRWQVLPPALAGVATIEWQQAGSEIEALLREGQLIRDLQPVVNIQTSAPALATRSIPSSLVQDVVLLVPSIDPDAAELMAARDDGATLLQRTSAERRRAHSTFPGTLEVLHPALARRWGRMGTSCVSWLARSGAHTTRLNRATPHPPSTFAFSWDICSQTRICFPSDLSRSPDAIAEISATTQRYSQRIVSWRVKVHRKVTSLLVAHVSAVAMVAELSRAGMRR